MQGVTCCSVIFQSVNRSLDKFTVALLPRRAPHKQPPSPRCRRSISTHRGRTTGAQIAGGATCTRPRPACALIRDVDARQCWAEPGLCSCAQRFNFHCGDVTPRKRPRITLTTSRCSGCESCNVTVTEGQTAKAEACCATWYAGESMELPMALSAFCCERVSVDRARLKRAQRYKQ